MEESMGSIERVPGNVLPEVDNGSSACGSVEDAPGPYTDENCDVADGFLFKSSYGSYSPRTLEKNSRGSEADLVESPDEGHVMIYQLLRNTAPRVKWREGLSFVLKESKSERAMRDCLFFLHSNVVQGIKATEKGYGENVQIETGSAPKSLKCHDWMSVMEGLNFDLTSPGTVRCIDYVDVAVGQNTDKEALNGFCIVTRALLEMSWANLKTIVNLTEDEGRFLYNILEILCSGYGINESDRQTLVELEEKYPYLLKCLGFRYSGKNTRLQWQLPETDTEFRKLSLSLHGLFRAANNIESVL